MKEGIAYLSLCCAAFFFLFGEAESQPVENRAEIMNQSGPPGAVGVPVTVWLSNTVPVTRFKFEITFDGKILAATDVELVPRTRGLELSGIVGTESWLYFEAAAASGKSLPTGSGPIVNIFFNVDSSAQPGTPTAIMFVPDSCTVWDTLGVPLPSLVLDHGVFRVGSVGIDDVESQAGSVSGYVRCYPNPFRSTATVQYSAPGLNQTNNLSLSIFDQMGKRVATLAEYRVEGNRYLFQWNGTHSNGDRLPSGVYFYRLHGVGHLNVPYGGTGRLVLIR